MAYSKAPRKEEQEGLIDERDTIKLIDIYLNEEDLQASRKSEDDKMFYRLHGFEMNDDLSNKQYSISSYTFVA